MAEVEAQAPHLVTVVKSEQGFGFNVRGQVTEGGQLKSISGRLYAPMQYISAVLEGGPAEKAGLKVGDRILEVNSNGVEGADHQTVVQHIRQSGNAVKLLVVSVSEEEARKLEPETTTSPSDYLERRSVPISIPELKKQKEEGSGVEYVTFEIHVSSKHVASRRYREFDALLNNLKRQYEAFLFPKLPWKWPFALNDTQLDARRRGLEKFLEDVCAARVVFEGDLMQDFLNLRKPGGASGTAAAAKKEEPKKEEAVMMTIQVLLADKRIVTTPVKEHWKTRDVYQAVVEKVGFKKPGSAKWFALFEHTTTFDRKLRDDDFPYLIYSQGHAHDSTGNTCILLKRWIFNTANEVNASSDPVAFELFYQQAVDDLGNGRLQAGDQKNEIEQLKTQNKQRFMELARSLPDYSSMVFPHCRSDARKTGNIILTITLDGMRVRACSTEGVPEKQEHNFPWEMIKKAETDLEEQSFAFQYARDQQQDPKWVRVFSPFYLYMELCVRRAKEEALANESV
ncbi:hypothetical protein EMCRGX_G022368 [Ephydatia muelleri]